MHARLGKPQRCCIFKEKRNGIHRVAWLYYFSRWFWP
jgi:hypothetical protein